MADQYRGRTRRNDDSMIPLLTVLVVIAAAGPALYAALTQWLLPRLTAGRDAVSLSLGEWWDRNWWLVLFWVLELTLLVAFLTWSTGGARGVRGRWSRWSPGLPASCPPTGSRIATSGCSAGRDIVRSGCASS